MIEERFLQGTEEGIEGMSDPVTRKEKEFLLELDRHFAYAVFPITSRNILAETFRITDEDAKWMVKEALMSDKNPYVEMSVSDLRQTPPKYIVEALRAFRAL